MERHGYDDGWGSNYKEQETVGFSQHHKLKKKMERNLFAGSFHCVKI